MLTAYQCAGSGAGSVCKSVEIWQKENSVHGEREKKFQAN